MKLNQSLFRCVLLSGVMLLASALQAKVITGIKRISKPGMKVYAKAEFVSLSKKLKTALNIIDGKEKIIIGDLIKKFLKVHYNE